MSARCTFMILTPILGFVPSLVTTGCGTPKPPAAGPAPAIAPAPNSGMPVASPSSAPSAPAAVAPPAAPPIDVAKTEPLAKLTVDEFVDSSIKDYQGTDAKYGGKVVQLQGYVHNLTRRIANGSVVGVSLQLKPTGSFDRVECEIS